MPGTLGHQGSQGLSSHLRGQICRLPLALTETQPVASGPLCCLFVALLLGTVRGLVSASRVARSVPCRMGALRMPASHFSGTRRLTGKPQAQALGTHFGIHLRRAKAIGDGRVTPSCSLSFKGQPKAGDGHSSFSG